jgi:hypoxia up-regulated 1
MSSAASGPTTRKINTVIFPAGSKVGTKKTLTFKRKEDFSVWLDYQISNSSFVVGLSSVSPHLDCNFPRGLPIQILEVDIIGVSDALGNLTELGAVDPVVKATVRLSESGFVSLPEAVAFGEIKDASLTGTKAE